MVLKKLYGEKLTFRLGDISIILLLMFDCGLILGFFNYLYVFIGLQAFMGCLVLFILIRASEKKNDKIKGVN